MDNPAFTDDKEDPNRSFVYRLSRDQVGRLGRRIFRAWNRLIGRPSEPPSDMPNIMSLVAAELQRFGQSEEGRALAERQMREAEEYQEEEERLRLERQFGRTIELQTVPETTTEGATAAPEAAAAEEAPTVQLEVRDLLLLEVGKFDSMAMINRLKESTEYLNNLTDEPYEGLTPDTLSDCSEEEKIVSFVDTLRRASSEDNTAVFCSRSTEMNISAEAAESEQEESNSPAESVIHVVETIEPQNDTWL